jgi:hypothetical protein
VILHSASYATTHKDATTGFKDRYVDVAKRLECLVNRYAFLSK